MSVVLTCGRGLRYRLAGRRGRPQGCYGRYREVYPLPQSGIKPRLSGHLSRGLLNAWWEAMFNRWNYCSKSELTQTHFLGVN